MTRVTKDLRENMMRSIMKDLPSRDYRVEIHKLVQDTVVEQLPPEVATVYADEDLRKYVVSSTIDVRKGNESISMWMRNDDFHVYGLTSHMVIRMDDAEHTSRLPAGSLYAAVVTAVAASGLVDAYFAQEDLRKSVSKRVRDNLEAAKTFKQLYEILEPELHHYIPKDEAKAQLPACVAPVVDDLRKLGAVLPETPKAN
jgi:hypothetical protein